MVLLFPSLLLLPSCASSRFTAGEQKNSLPVADRPHLEEVHSIAVAPFYHDKDHWRRLVHEGLAGPKIALIPAGRVDAAVRESRKDFSTLDPGLRPEALMKIGRSVHADAVVNGLVLSRGDHHELVLQLISSNDARVLFWQAVVFSPPRGHPDVEGQRKLISRMLAPLLTHVAAHQRPLISAPEETEGQPHEQLKPEDRPAQEKMRKPDEKRESLPEEISPM